MMQPFSLPRPPIVFSIFGSQPTEHQNTPIIANTPNKFNKVMVNIPLYLFAISKSINNIDNKPKFVIKDNIWACLHTISEEISEILLNSLL